MNSIARRARRAPHTRLFIILFACVSFSLCFSCASRQQEQRAPLVKVNTLAGSDNALLSFVNPFGVAVSQDGTLFVTDGAQDSLHEIAPDGATKVITKNLNTPSGVALASDGTLVVADTGSHTIKRVDPRTGGVNVIAGRETRAGFADGSRAEALFDGPLGVAVATDGTIYVADTYNDRIRSIDAQGNVSTLAGSGASGHADAADGAQARFHTPCGIAIAPDGALIIADTGNHRLRRVELTGAVTTIAGTSEAGHLDGFIANALFAYPMGVAVDGDGTIYVAESSGTALRACTFKLIPHVFTVAGGQLFGLADGTLMAARFNHPSGIAVAPDGTLFIADTGNRLVRAVLRESKERGRAIKTEEAQARRPSAADFRAQGAPRWPYEPPERTREIAATFGEIRGEIKDHSDAWFHNGLDIPGAYGETVRLVRDERVLYPLSVEGIGTARERIRFPSLGYIHLRVGRNRDNKAFDDERFRIMRDTEGKATDVRVRRGAQFKAGEALGTLNDQYHVHLIAGPLGWEYNALAALDLPGVKDTVAPVIEKDGVVLLNRNGEQLTAASSDDDRKREQARTPIDVKGDVRIVVRAYDQMDGNAARRKLGLYRLGYRILKMDGAPAPGFEQDVVTISFETLPDDPATARFAYADGSQSGYTGQTIFAYIVTNRVRDRAATEDYWHASELPSGDYVVEVFAEDFFGNRTTRSVPVRISGQ